MRYMPQQKHWQIKCTSIHEYHKSMLPNFGDYSEGLKTVLNSIPNLHSNFDFDKAIFGIDNNIYANFWTYFSIVERLLEQFLNISEHFRIFKLFEFIQFSSKLLKMPKTQTLYIEHLWICFFNAFFAMPFKNIQSSSAAIWLLS